MKMRLSGLKPASVACRLLADKMTGCRALLTVNWLWVSTGPTGVCVGETLGKNVGDRVGSTLGLKVGTAVGSREGAALGKRVGTTEGNWLGAQVGENEGERVGIKVGNNVAPVVIGDK